MTYEPPETVIRDAMETFGQTRDEAIAEMSRIDRAFGIADEEEK